MTGLPDGGRERRSAGVRPAADPGALLSDWMTGAVTGDTRLQPRLLRLADGHLLPLDVERWAGPASAADATLLERASGPVLDVGCGPGRLTAALHGAGVEVLGLDVLPAVPVLARRAGAPVHVGDVFAPLPREDGWRTVLLADGNLGIGGDPARLLRRLAELLAPDGVVLAELHPGSGERRGRVRLEALGSASTWFPWSLVAPDAVPALAERSGLAVVEQWSAGGRPFAALAQR
ncbi:MAG TPA: class I SAM-dependent methyltransferase [Mycobacteriales bacterium]|nr:class I SAM-dependent methyltransferase [Mycobacteriales bacterium]